MPYDLEWRASPGVLTNASWTDTINVVDLSAGDILQWVRWGVYFRHNSDDPQTGIPQLFPDGAVGLSYRTDTQGGPDPPLTATDPYFWLDRWTFSSRTTWNAAVGEENNQPFTYAASPGWGQPWHSIRVAREAEEPGSLWLGWERQIDESGDLFIYWVLHALVAVPA